MDEVNFSTHPQGGTVVRMIKRKPETPQDADSDGLSAD
jgi:hypothetical protein